MKLKKKRKGRDQFAPKQGEGNQWLERQRREPQYVCRQVRKIHGPHWKATRKPDGPQAV
jgi:hypothetical protein